MYPLSNLYRILSKCIVKGASLDEATEPENVVFDLLEFIEDSNNEIYHALNYKLCFEENSLKKLFKNEDQHLPQIKILVFNCHHIYREDVERIISYKFDALTDTILFEYDDGEMFSLRLNHLDQYEEKAVEMFNIKDFLANLEENIFIDNHWITALLSGPDEEGLKPDQEFMHQFRVHLG